MVAEFNFTLEQYSADEVDFSYDGDLTGCSVHWFVQPKVGSKTPLILKTMGNGVTITSTSSTQSTFSVSVTNEDMASIAAGDYYHQATMVDALGESNPIVHGRLTVEPESNN